MSVDKINALASATMTRMMDNLCPPRLAQLFMCRVSNQKQRGGGFKWVKEILIEKERYFAVIEVMDQKKVKNMLVNNYTKDDSYVLLDKLIEHILEEISNGIKNYYVSGGNITYKSEVDCDIACKSIINSFCKENHIGNHPLITQISEKYYEGKECTGKILICQHPDTTGRKGAMLSDPLEFDKSNIKKIRKLLEATGADSYLLIDSSSQMVIGIGEVDPKDFFIIEFQGFLHWQIRFNDKIVFRYALNKYNLFDMVDSIDANVEKKYLGIIEKIVSNRHGAILIIADGIQGEAKRLCNLDRGYQIKGFSAFAHEDLIEMATRMDGAVLLDNRGRCYAMGVILDGIAAAGSVGHGSRHNSTKSYVMWKREEFPTMKAIVVSEDGPVTTY